MSPKLSVILPAYNEAEGLGQALEQTYAVLKDIGGSFEIIVVDDGSSDHTWDVVSEYCGRWPELSGLRLSRNFGKENAICAGLDGAAGDAVILSDADLQHPPQIIADMLEKWRQGFQVVEAVKRRRVKENWLTRTAARCFYALLSFLTDFDLRGASDFKLLDRAVIDAWKAMGERNVFFRGMAAWVGFRRTQVEFDVAPRTTGQSKWSRLQLIGLALKAITAFSTAPLRIVTLLGAGFLVFSLLLAAHTLYMYFSGQAVTGFSTVILLILLTSSIVMLALGIIGEYIARIYEEVKQRPRYIVAERR
ncbi:MAG: glycosyltransferase family 2 protein [Mariprofundus sp.]